MSFEPIEVVQRYGSILSSLKIKLFAIIFSYIPPQNTAITSGITEAKTLDVVYYVDVVNVPQ